MIIPKIGKIYLVLITDFFQYLEDSMSNLPAYKLVKRPDQYHCHKLSSPRKIVKKKTMTRKRNLYNTCSYKMRNLFSVFFLLIINELLWTRKLKYKKLNSYILLFFN